MNHFDQVHQLYQMLKQARLPVTKHAMQTALEVSKGTVKNRLNELRDRYHAPIKYIAKGRGYIFTNDKYELKGIWFSQNELHALLMIEQQMEQLEPGLISNQLKIAKQKITQLIQQQLPKNNAIQNRLRILSIHNKTLNANNFAILAQATLQRKQVHIHFKRNADQQISLRTLSPQCLVFYKSNWYIDAYCHSKKSIRTFAVNGIKKIQASQNTAKEINLNNIQQQTSSSYGIFSGQPTQTATIEFTAPNSHWVSQENWHSQQQGAWLNKQTYQLKIPYQHDNELIMDILKHGECAKVISPKTLQDKLKNKINKMQKKY